MIALEELSSAVSHTGGNAIDTVVVGIVDMQGRLQGKRFHAQHFVDVVTREGTEGCNYLLAVAVDMNTVDGYAMSSWAGGRRAFAAWSRPFPPRLGRPAPRPPPAPPRPPV